MAPPVERPDGYGSPHGQPTPTPRPALQRSGWRALAGLLALAGALPCLAAEEGEASGSLQVRALRRLGQGLQEQPSEPAPEWNFKLRPTDPYADLRQHNLLRLDMGAQGRLRLKARGRGVTLQWQAEW